MRVAGYTLGRGVRDADRAPPSTTNRWPIRRTFSHPVAPDSEADIAENSPQLMRESRKSMFTRQLFILYAVFILLRARLANMVPERMTIDDRGGVAMIGGVNRRD
jgi:hypothetical protein